MPDTIPPIVAAAPAGGTYASLALTVVLSADETAEIRYTLDGSMPTVASPLYAAPLSLPPGNYTLHFFGIDTAGNASEPVAELYQVNLPAIEPINPPPAWLSAFIQQSPGPAGAWESLPAPQVPASSSPAIIHGITGYRIILDGADVTALADGCSLDDDEGTALGTVSVKLPVGVEVLQGTVLNVIWGGVDHYYLVEEVSAPDGPRREIWGRSAACILDAPHAAEGAWNGWDNPHATAFALATSLAGSVPLAWQCDDWPLPPSWDLSGTPLEAIRQLAEAVGAIVQSTPAGGLTVRRRWPVRPPDLPASAVIATISRDSALDLSSREESGQGWGSLTVYGYDPAADLPDLEVEESSPQHGSAVHVRLYWQRTTPPGFTHFVTDGAASSLGNSDTVVTAEEITFEDGTGSARYPVKILHGWVWLGNDQGGLWRLNNGDRRELSMADPGGRGIALVTYTTSYERWQLTGQTAAKVIFGVDVSQGAIAARVSYATGGSVAPAVNTPLLGSVAACVAAGTAHLDDSRARSVVSAELPLTTAAIVTGSTVQVIDPALGISGKGKVTRVSCELDPAPKSVRKIEVQLCR